MENFQECAKLSFKCLYHKNQSQTPCLRKFDSLHKIAHHIYKEHSLSCNIQQHLKQQQSIFCSATNDTASVLVTNLNSPNNTENPIIMPFKKILIVKIPR